MCTNDMDRLGEFSAPIPLILFCHFPARRSDSLARTLRTTRAWQAYVPQRPRNTLSISCSMDVIKRAMNMCERSTREAIISTWITTTSRTRWRAHVRQLPLFARLLSTASCGFWAAGGTDVTPNTFVLDVANLDAGWHPGPMMPECSASEWALGQRLHGGRGEC